MQKVVHVHLIYSKRNYYFGSISAVFDYLTEEEVGVTKETLLHAGLGREGVKVTPRAMITVSTLKTAKRGG